MRTFCCQFFATTDELVVFVTRWMAHGRIYAAATEFPFFSVRELRREDADERLRQPRVSKVVFYGKPIDLRAKTGNELHDMNPGLLVLTIGHMKPECIEESCLSTLDAKPEWKAILADLKRSTKAGMEGRSRMNGSSAVYRTERYTSGAARCADQGTLLKQAAQSPVVFSPVKSRSQ